jgi:hypothetical protein
MPFYILQRIYSVKWIKDQIHNLFICNYDGDTRQPCTHVCYLYLEKFIVTANLRNNLLILFPGDLELFNCMWL